MIKKKSISVPKEKFLIRLKFKTKKYEIEDNFDNLREEEIFKIFQAFILKMGKDWLNFFKERYTRMKNIRKLNLGMESELNSNNDCSSIKVGRNEPCPCGSGKKYKKCCGK